MSWRTRTLLRTTIAVAALISSAARSFAGSPAPESRFAQVDGSKVHYTDYGAGENALLFVHGWSCDETFWVGQASALASKFHVITIDLPGHGQSDKPQVHYTMDLYVRAIDEVLRDAKAKSATLVGHSNGTPVIRQFYRRFPEKTRALVIVDGGLRPFGDKATMEKFVATLKAPNYEENAGRMIDGMVRPIQDAPLRERIKVALLRTPQFVAASEMEGTLDPELWRPDKITVPVLMILAKQPVWTPEYENFVRGLVPDLDYQTWANVSHFLMMEKPNEFNAALTAFLEKHGLAKN
jgi:pimeloyl-ACP methyl ester carboxylesterase